MNSENAVRVFQLNYVNAMRGIRYLEVKNPDEEKVTYTLNQVIAALEVCRSKGIAYMSQTDMYYYGKLLQEAKNRCVELST